MPVNTSEIQISSDINSKPGDELIAAHETVSMGLKSSIANSWVFQRSENGKIKTVIKVINGQTRAIREAQADEKGIPYA